jgi:hypothetical protein
MLALAGCARPDDAALFAEALAASGYDDGARACTGLSRASDRGDCAVAVIGRFAHWDACTDVETEVWREECWFAAAEQLAAQKDRAGALRACTRSRFVSNCDNHVLDGLAMDLRDGSIADAAVVYAGLATDVVAADGELDFWRSYFRLRLAAGLPLTVEGCPERTCRDAARKEVSRALEADPSCAPPAWIGDDRVASWVAYARRSRCRGSVERPGGPDDPALPLEALPPVE